MYNFEKTSEKTLGLCIDYIFSERDAIINKQFKLDFYDRKMFIDYHVYDPKLNMHIFFEFDGPTHYTNTKTQERDNYLEEYFSVSDFVLIRIPYFLQFNDRAMLPLLKGNMKLFDIFDGKLNSKYNHGFIDKNIVLPGNFNNYGFSKFLKDYRMLMDYDRFSIARQIYDSLDNRPESKEIIFGLDYRKDITKMEFIMNYPT